MIVPPKCRSIQSQQYPLSLSIFFKINHSEPSVIYYVALSLCIDVVFCHPALTGQHNRHSIHNMTAADIAATGLSIGISVLAFFIRHAISVTIYLHNSFPNASSFVLLILWVYLIYRFTRLLFVWWIHLIVTAIKLITASLMIFSVGTIYLRGYDRLVNQDYPAIVNYFEDLPRSIAQSMFGKIGEGFNFDFDEFSSEFFNDFVEPKTVEVVGKAKKTEKKDKKKKNINYLDGYIKKFSESQDPEVGEMLSNGFEYLKGIL